MASKFQTARPLDAGTLTQPLVVADGSLEALKWLAMGLMALDHINKYLLGERVLVLFDLGRIVMPIFGFVLMYNLSRPGALAAGVHRRVMQRLLFFGLAASPVFADLVGWWPLNILFMLLLSTAMVGLLESGGATRLALAAVTFVLAGAFVEFWWFGVATCIASWAYCRRPDPARLALWTLATASLWIVNRNLAALAALPLIWVATQVELKIPRRRWLFYGFYPIHLSAIWIAQQCL